MLYNNNTNHMLRSTLTKRRNAALCKEMRANALGLSPISHEQLLKQTQKFARKSGGYAPSVPNFDDAIFINGRPIIDYTEPKFNPLLENNKHFVLNKIDNMTPIERRTLFEEFKSKAEIDNLNVISKIITSASEGISWLNRNNLMDEFRAFLRTESKATFNTPIKTRNKASAPTAVPTMRDKKGNALDNEQQLNKLYMFASRHTDHLTQGHIRLRHPIVSAYGIPETSKFADDMQFTEFLKSEAMLNRAMPERRYQMKPMSSGAVNYPSVSTFTPPSGGYPSPSTSSSGNSSVYTMSTP